MGHPALRARMLHQSPAGPDDPCPEHGYLSSMRRAHGQQNIGPPVVGQQNIGPTAVFTSLVSAVTRFCGRLFRSVFRAEG